MGQEILLEAAQIRQTTSADARTISALHCRNFHCGWSETDVQSLLNCNAGIGFMAFEEGVAAGFLLAHSVAPEAEIISIAVDLAFRRRGLAQAMLAVFEEKLQARYCTTIFLEVAETNYSAVDLYLGCGFEQAGARPGYYKLPDGSRVSALIFRKTLH